MKPNPNQLRQAQGDLVQFYGHDKPMDEITLGDADEFRRDLLGRLRRKHGTPGVAAGRSDSSGPPSARN